MKNILFVITKGEVGGAQRVVYNLATGFRQKGFEITVGLGQEGWLSEKLKSINIPAVKFRNLGRTFNPFANLFFIFEIKRFLEREKFNVIHFHSSNALFGAIGAKLAKSKPRTIFTFHGLSLLDPNYRTFFIFKYLYFLIFKILLFFIDVKVFVSNRDFELAKKMKPVKEGVVIYNGVDESGFNFLTKTEARQFFAGKIGANLENKFIIGSNGRLAYPKNYEFIIEIFPEILKVEKRVIYIIISNGPERKKYEKLIFKKGLKDKIFLAGEILDAPNYCKAFDLFVLPSIYEGLPMVLLEASYAGLPILASDVGGNREAILNPENQLYRLNDKTDFLEKFRKIESDEILRKKLGEENRLNAQKFTALKMMQDYSKIF